MRTRTIVAALTLALGAGAAGGCQILAGLSTLQVAGTGGAGGAGGPGGTGGGTPCKPGTPCGGTCIGSTVTPPGTCDSAGKCPSQPHACDNGFGCNTAQTLCNTTCTQNDQCAAGDTCAPGPPNGGGPPSQCLACGTPPMGHCLQAMDGGADGGCEACDVATETCVTTCSASAPCTGSSTAPLIVDAQTSAAKLECDGKCSNNTIQCRGLFPCTVHCPSASGQPTCMHTTVICDQGPCTLACDMMGCAGVTMMCGGNECTATSFAPPNMPAPVGQTCGKACKCTPGNDGGA